MKLRPKLILLLLFSMIPLLVSNSVGYLKSKNIIEQNIYEQLMAENAFKKAALEGWIENRQKLLKSMAKRPSVSEYLAQILSAAVPESRQKQAYQKIALDHFKIFMEEIGGFKELFILDAKDGRIVVSTHKIDEGTYKDNEPFFIEGRKTTFLRNPFYDLSHQEAMITLSTPVKDKKGAVTGVLAAYMDLKELSVIMKKQSGITKTQETYLVNQFNFMVTDSAFQVDQILRKTVYSDGAKKALNKIDGTGEYKDYRDVMVLGSFQWIEKYHLAILTEIDKAEAFATLKKLGITVGVLVGIIAILVVILGLYFVRTITRPIQELVYGVKAFGRGDLDAHIKVTGRDEISVLAGAFNEMANQRKKAEQDLKLSEQQFRTIADFTYNWEDWIRPDGTYHYVSPAFGRITGYAPDHLLENPDFLIKILHSDDKKEFSTHIAGCHDEKAGATETEFRVISQTGETHWISHTCQPVYDSDGKWLGRRISNRDITQHKKIEQQFLQAQKMEAVGNLAGGVAHDFNNLMMVVIGVSQLVLMELDPKDPLCKELEEIKSAGERAASVTRQLLTFSRKQIREVKVFDLNLLIKNFEKMIGRLIGEDIELQWILSDPLPPVKADPGQMEQVLMNLAVNARDAMPKGGKLIIETALTKMDEAYGQMRGIEPKPGDYVLLSVSDTGLGMSDEVKAKIFDPFFTTKQRGQGTGLGLSTVYGIVKQAGGYIWVYSEPGQGTSFKVYLPVVEEQPQDLSKQSTVLENCEGRETILVVEDDNFLRNLIVKGLGKYGYTILSAGDGKEALDIVHRDKKNIEILITDVVMPGMSGVELAQKIKPVRQGIKVLYISGYTDNTIVHNGLLKPGVNFFQKPFTLNSLAQKIRKILDGK